MPPERSSDQRRRERESRARALPRPYHRSYGYRGYGSGFGRGTEDYGGRVHWGSGFAGVGSLGAYGGDTLPHVRFFEAQVGLGPYGGLGPKGYSRSDDRIWEDICDELTRRADIDPSRLTVRVRNGEVTLEGTVEDLHTRRLVDEIVSDCIGVGQVHNQLQIEGGKEVSSPEKGKVTKGSLPEGRAGARRNGIRESGFRSRSTGVH